MVASMRRTIGLVGVVSVSSVALLRMGVMSVGLVGMNADIACADGPSMRGDMAASAYPDQANMETSAGRGMEGNEDEVGQTASQVAPGGSAVSNSHHGSRSQSRTVAVSRGPMMVSSRRGQSATRAGSSSAARKSKRRKIIIITSIIAVVVFAIIIGTVFGVRHLNKKKKEKKELKEKEEKDAKDKKEKEEKEAKDKKEKEAAAQGAGKITGDPNKTPAASGAGSTPDKSKTKAEDGKSPTDKSGQKQTEGGDSQKSGTQEGDDVEGEPKNQTKTPAVDEKLGEDGKPKLGPDGTPLTGDQPQPSSSDSTVELSEEQRKKMQEDDDAEKSRQKVLDEENREKDAAAARHAEEQQAQLAAEEEQKRLDEEKRQQDQAYNAAVAGNKLYTVDEHGIKSYDGKRYNEHDQMIDNEGKTVMHDGSPIAMPGDLMEKRPETSLETDIKEVARDTAQDIQVSENGFRFNSNGDHVDENNAVITIKDEVAKNEQLNTEWATILAKRGPNEQDPAQANA